MKARSERKVRNSDKRAVLKVYKSFPVGEAVERLKGGIKSNMLNFNILPNILTLGNFLYLFKNVFSPLK